MGNHLLRAVNRLAGPVGVIVGAAALFVLAGSRGTVAAHALPRQAAPADDVAFGRRLFEVRCSSCHGLNGEGVVGKAPEVAHAGAAAADFFLRTGRMPLADYHDQPVRHRPAYPDNEIRALVAFVGSLDAGTPIPQLPAGADLSSGFRLYSINCAQCHNDAGAGGALGFGDIVPSLIHASRLDAAEAMRIGPVPMPVFGPDTLSDQQVADVAAYVQYLHHPDDRGGLGLGHLGPIPEGFVGWVVGMGLLLLVARLIGTRA
jgi:ubiquinol-cytochrome c reductase cytochrome c subunit